MKSASLQGVALLCHTLQANIFQPKVLGELAAQNGIKPHHLVRLNISALVYPGVWVLPVLNYICFQMAYAPKYHRVRA